jgi:hypothetical protein
MQPGSLQTFHPPAFASWMLGLQASTWHFLTL